MLFFGVVKKSFVIRKKPEPVNDIGIILTKVILMLGINNNIKPYKNNMKNTKS
jgi:hypothetical protein